MKRSSAHGFTLVELTISSTIAVGILAASYLCLRAGLRTQKAIEKRGELAQTARVVLGLLGADLRSAWKLSRDLDFVGMNSADDGTNDGTEADRLLFGSRHWKPSGPGEGDFCEVSYGLRKQEGSDSYQLVRDRTPFPDDNPLEGGEPEVLADGVHGLHLEYYDGLYWYDEWGRVPGVQLDTTADSLAGNTKGLPDAVRIVLSFEDPDPPDGAKRAAPVGVSAARGPAGQDGAPENSLRRAPRGGTSRGNNVGSGGASEPVAAPYAFQSVVALHFATRAAQAATTAGPDTTGTNSESQNSNSNGNESNGERGN